MNRTIQGTLSEAAGIWHASGEQTAMEVSTNTLQGALTINAMNNLTLGDFPNFRRLTQIVETTTGEKARFCAAILRPPGSG
jgi:hypothetical protein